MIPFPFPSLIVFFSSFLTYYFPHYFLISFHFNTSSLLPHLSPFSSHSNTTSLRIFFPLNYYSFSFSFLPLFYSSSSRTLSLHTHLAFPTPSFPGFLRKVVQKAAADVGKLLAFFSAQCGLFQNISSEDRPTCGVVYCII